MGVLTRSQLLDLARRTTDPEWLDPLLADGSSLAVLSAMAEVFSQVSRRSEHNANQALITRAGTGTPGSSLVAIVQSPTPTPPGGTIPKLGAGLGFLDARQGVHTLPADIVIPGVPFSIVTASKRLTELMNTVDDPVMRFAPSSNIADATNTTPITIKTTRPHGYTSTSVYVSGAWPAPQAVKISGVKGNIAANGLWQTVVVVDTYTFTLTGSVGNGVYNGEGIVQNAPWNCAILSASPIDNASSDYLSVMGRERGKAQQNGEAAEDYRARVRNISDVVSPIAMSAAVNGAAQSVGIKDVRLYEPFEDGSDPTIDAGYGFSSIPEMLFYDSTNPGSVGSPYSYAYDDVSSVALSARESTVYFRIKAFGLTSAQWTDPVKVAGLLAVHDSATQAKAGGVQFDLHVDSDIWVTGQGTRTLASEAVVVTLTPPAGKKWKILAVVIGRTGAVVSGGSFRLEMDKLLGGTAAIAAQTPVMRTSSYALHTFDADALMGADVATVIRGYLTADGTNINKLVVSALVREV